MIQVDYDSAQTTQDKWPSISQSDDLNLLRHPLESSDDIPWNMWTCETLAAKVSKTPSLALLKVASFAVPWD